MDFFVKTLCFREERLSAVILSLGSNLGWKKHHLKRAVRYLRLLGTVRKLSRFYRTLPYGKTDQPDFLNCAASLETDLPPQTLLDSVHSIEDRMGRVRKEKWGPRKIDIDIVFYEDLVLDTPDLKIPHPDMQNRDFVLKPLMDICPEYVHPVLKKTIRELVSPRPTATNLL
jgi:2-amino-4-hydroxy-6-hydroxymethyldihydropteridine diphosphokinase